MLEKLELDHAGIAQILKSPAMRSAVHTAAEQVANNAAAQADGAEVVVDDYTTDRAASAVTIKDPRALLWQVRDGVLTRAAAAAGLEVKERGG